LDMCVQEIRNGQDDAFKLLNAKKYKEEIDHLKKLLDLYPWSIAVYHELSIAYDEDGNHEMALDLIYPAIVLNPTNPECWKSLAVILNRLGFHEEANIASAFKEIFKEQAGQRKQ